MPHSHDSDAQYWFSSLNVCGKTYELIRILAQNRVSKRVLVGATMKTKVFNCEILF